MTREKFTAECVENYQDALHNATEKGKAGKEWGMEDLTTGWNTRRGLAMNIADMTALELEEVIFQLSQMKKVIEDNEDAIKELYEAKAVLENMDKYECDDDVVD